MTFSFCQLRALFFTVSAFTPCTCKKTQCGSDAVCSDDAIDEVAALQVHVNLAKIPPPMQSESSSRFTKEPYRDLQAKEAESNILTEEAHDTNAMTKTTNAAKETMNATFQAIAQRKPTNITDALATAASGGVLKHIVKEDDRHLIVTHQAIPQKNAWSLNEILFSIASGTGLKIFLGLDDLIWLGPMIAISHDRTGKCRIVITYAFATLIVCATAVYLGAFVDNFGSSVDSLNFWISIVSGAMLMTYSTYMAYSEGWFARCGLQGDDDEEDDLKFECEKRKPMSFRQVFTISVLGSVDDWSALFLLGTSGLFTWWSMCIGTFLGSVCLAGIVMLGTESQTISSALERMPMPLVLFLVGVWVTTKAFEPIDGAISP